jgi:hypothetical protein
MQGGLKKGLIIGILAGAACCGAAWAQSDSDSSQSLGDVARATRAKTQAEEQAAAPPKVITNQDLPAGSSAGTPDSGQPMTQVSGVKKPNPYADQRVSNQLQAQERARAQWKARIHDQENRIADLQARIDHINAQTQAAIGTATYDTPVNRYQMIQEQRVANLQEQLDQQKRKLEEMQDAARRAGADQ